MQVLKNNIIQCKEALKDAGIGWLYEVCGECVAQTVRNSRTRSGATKGSFEYSVDEGSLTGYVGSNHENAIWEEFGTGEYALKGDGRKDVPWVYKDDSGHFHSTKGKKPSRAFHKAYENNKAKFEKRAKELVKQGMGG